MSNGGAVGFQTALKPLDILNKTNILLKPQRRIGKKI